MPPFGSYAIINQISSESELPQENMNMKLYTYLRNRKIYARLFKTNLMLAVIPLVLLAALFIIIYVSTSSHWFSEQELETLKNYSGNITNELYHFDSSIVGISQDDRTQYLLNEYIVMSDYEKYHAIDELTAYVIEQLHMLGYVTDVALVTNNYDLLQVFSGPHDDFTPDELDYVSFVKASFLHKSNTFLDDARNYKNANSDQNHNGFLYVKRVTDMENNAIYIGYILAYIDKKTFFNISSSSDKDYYILDADGTMVFSSLTPYTTTDAQLFGDDVSNNLRSDAGSFVSGQFKAGRLPSLCAYYRMQLPDWFIISTIPYSVFLSNVWVIVAITLALILLISLTQAFLSSAIAHSMDVPIQQIQQALTRVEKGDFTPDSMQAYKDELATVHNSLNYTITLLGQLFEQTKKDERNKYLLQLQALQSQMNPHFLMNTINSMILLADLQGADNIKAFGRALSRLLRDMLENQQLTASIEKELSLLKDYELIMQYHYFDRFKIDFEISVDTSRTEIPKTILQPMVENALLHGLSETDPFITITIRIYTHQDMLVIEVCDDGLGIEPAHLTQMLTAGFDKKDEKKRSTSIGLHNINKRIRLLYGSDYGLSIESSVKQGTRVIIRLPIIQIGSDAKYIMEDEGY